MTPLYTEIIGWSATVLLLLAYLLNSRGVLTARSRAYQAMNALGCLGVGIHVWHAKSYPAVALQLVWGSIALYSLFFPAKEKSS